MTSIEDVPIILHYIKELEKMAGSHISNVIGLLPVIKGELNDQSIELNKGDNLYLEYVWTLFKMIFWNNEAALTLTSKLIGPFFLEIQSKSKWVTINISPNENRYLKTRPFAFYDFESNTFSYINKSLKSKLFNDDINFKNSSFCNYNRFKNINEEQANLLALHFRVTFFSKKIKIVDDQGLLDFITNNLVCMKIEYPEGKFFKIYSLIDYGLPDPEFDQKIGENSGTIKDLVDTFNSCYQMFSPRS